MPDFGIKITAKNFFLDRAAVVEKLGVKSNKSRSAFAKVGAFVRRRARSSMRRRKKPAAAGTPPSAHAGDLKNKLWFAYDPSISGVVVGPLRYRDGKAPNLLEFGGKAVRSEKGKKETFRYAGNPFMAPALKAELDAGTIPKQWASSIG